MCPKITEYMENATPQMMSFARAGSARWQKSRLRALLRTSRYLGFSFIWAFREISRQPTGPLRAETAVAKATPRMPSLGTPSSPKINTAFSRIFRENPTAFSTMQTVALPILRRIAV